jgi:hypothetical protein
MAFNCTASGLDLTNASDGSEQRARGMTPEGVLARSASSAPMSYGDTRRIT